MKVRIKFGRYGIMRFIDHPDVTHCLRKAIRRADVDVYYSGGLPSHQTISFAAPLGVEVVSNGEYVDIEAASIKNSEIMKRCLSGVVSENFEVADYRILPDDAANTISIVGIRDYTPTFRSGYEPEDMDKEQRFQGLIASFECLDVMVTERTKHEGREMDLRPLVYGLSIYPGGNGGAEEPHLPVKISTGGAADVKPEWVLDAYYGFLGKERPPFAFMVQWEEVHTGRASETERGTNIYPFISLEQLGEEVG